MDVYIYIYIIAIINIREYLKTTCNLIITECPGNKVATSEINYCKTVEQSLDVLDNDTIAYELSNKLKTLTSYYAMMKKKYLFIFYFLYFIV